jgi:hypothetical protein
MSSCPSGGEDTDKLYDGSDIEQCECPNITYLLQDIYTII